jgi:hypothetical protein
MYISKSGKPVLPQSTVHDYPHWDILSPIANIDCLALEEKFLKETKRVNFIKESSFTLLEENPPVAGAIPARFCA